MLGMVGCASSKYNDVCYDKHHNVISCIQEFNDKQLEDHGFGGGL